MSAPLSPHARRQRRERLAASALLAASLGGLVALAFLPTGAGSFVALGGIVAGACAAMGLSD